VRGARGQLSRFIAWIGVAEFGVAAFAAEMRYYSAVVVGLERQRGSEIGASRPAAIGGCHLVIRVGNGGHRTAARIVGGVSDVIESVGH